MKIVFIQSTHLQLININNLMIMLNSEGIQGFDLLLLQVLLTLLVVNVSTKSIYVE